MDWPWKDVPDDESDLPRENPEDASEEDESFRPWASFREEADFWEEAEGVDAEGEDSFIRIPYEDFSEIPAWQKAHRFALRITAFLRKADPKVRRHPALVNLRGQAYLGAVDIAYGHDEGYEPDLAGENLERCRQALDRIHQCLLLIDTLGTLTVLPAEPLQELFDEAISVRDAIVYWMEEVRRL